MLLCLFKTKFGRRKSYKFHFQVCVHHGNFNGFFLSWHEKERRAGEGHPSESREANLHPVSHWAVVELWWMCVKNFVSYLTISNKNFTPPIVPTDLVVFQTSGWRSCEFLGSCSDSPCATFSLQCHTLSSQSLAQMGFVYQIIQVEVEEKSQTIWYLVDHHTVEEVRHALARTKLCL